MSTESEAGWSKEYPSLKYGSWFWLRHTLDSEPELHQLTGGRNWMESFGIVRETTEFLGPITPADTEQLVRLREAAQSALEYLQPYAGTNRTINGTVAALRNALDTEK